MRSSNLLLPLAFLFIISSISAKDLITGVWSSPKVVQNASSLCCIPPYISLENSGNNKYTASYRYPRSNFDPENNVNNDKCYFVFARSGSGSLNLSLSNNDSINSYSGNAGLPDSLRFYFETLDSNGASVLRVWTPIEGQCEFVMQSLSHPQFTALLIFLCILFVIVAFAAFKIHQKKQSYVKRPQNRLVQQQYSQPQEIYTAPVQFHNNGGNGGFYAQR